MKSTSWRDSNQLDQVAAQVCTIIDLARGIQVQEDLMYLLTSIMSVYNSNQIIILG